MIPFYSFPFSHLEKSEVLFCGWGENKRASQEKKGLSQQLCWAARLSSWQSNRPCPNSRLENKPAQDILTENSQEDPDSDLEIPHPENKSKPAKRTTNLVWDRNSSLFEIMLTAGVGRREGSGEGDRRTLSHYNSRTTSIVCVVGGVSLKGTNLHLVSHVLSFQS